MKSAIQLVMGLSMFAAAVSAVGCSSSDSSPGTGPVANSAGTTGSGGSGGSGSSDLPAGIPLTPADGWVDGASNTAMIQGALFTYADTTTMMSLMDTIKSGTGMNCMSGTAAKVDLMCTVVAPATDCYGTTWGAAMGLNLNQPIDPTTMMGVMTPLAFDATAAGITGFAFDISGDMVPTGANFRFLINDMAGNQYCTATAKAPKKGPNVYKLSDLVEECWQASKPTDLTGDTAANNIVKIAWQVVTNSSNTVPFNFCIDNIEALKN
ncbi:MAG TPA: hypothetical protein VHV51_05550 [Polyangiaceae bacterium]|jgi:hypothetical protein|nr:hypothetical protein [Polyangiaceae bacterium]